MKTPRRNRIARAGLVILLMSGALVACIFDKGDYEGGGRQPTVTATVSSATDTPPPPPGPPGDAGNSG